MAADSQFRDEGNGPSPMRETEPLSREIFINKSSRVGFFSCLFVSFNPGWNYLLQSFWLLKSGDKKLNWSTGKTEVLIWEQQITVLTQIMQTRSFTACKRHAEILFFIFYTYIYNCSLPGLPCRMRLWTWIFSSCEQVQNWQGSRKFSCQFFLLSYSSS